MKSLINQLNHINKKQHDTNTNNNNKPGTTKRHT